MKTTILSIVLFIAASFNLQAQCEEQETYVQLTRLAKAESLRCEIQKTIGEQTLKELDLNRNVKEETGGTVEQFREYIKLEKELGSSRDAQIKVYGTYSVDFNSELLDIVRQLKSTDEASIETTENLNTIFSIALREDLTQIIVNK